VFAARPGAHALAEIADHAAVLLDVDLEREEPAVIVERRGRIAATTDFFLDDVAEGLRHFARAAEQCVGFADIRHSFDEAVQILERGCDLVLKLVALVVRERRAAHQRPVEDLDLMLQTGEVVVQRRRHIRAEGFDRRGVGFIGHGLMLDQFGALEVGDLAA
jgi:hypothetical protein